MSTSIEYQKFRARMGIKEDPPPQAPKVVWTFRDILIAAWVFFWIPASIWVGTGNPNEDFFYAIFWGGFIAFMTVYTLAGCFARIWLAYHSAEIAENIYRGLCSRR